VHVLEAHRRLSAAGIECRVLNTERGGARARHWANLLLAVLDHARRGWIVHLHTNGHNSKSWLLAVACGLAARLNAGSLLTLHSGMTPGYLADRGAASPGRAGLQPGLVSTRASVLRRWLARFACSLYTRVVCVSPEIRTALLSLGVPRDRTEILPAYLGSHPSNTSLDPEWLLWLERHRPVLSTALFFRPEYGFDLLVETLVQLRRRHPAVGCVVMGSGEQQEQAKQRVREARLEDVVLLAGDVKHDACLAWMSASDVFVRPTLEDGDSVSVREALALGTPVVASATGMRPPGTILFQTGSVDDMLSKVEVTISAPERRAALPEDSGARLIEIYRQLAAPTEVYAAA
jgi:glycosyltransferase involved in cell wall biosynthesis